MAAIAGPSIAKPSVARPSVTRPSVGEFAEMHAATWADAYEELGISLEPGFIARADHQARAILRTLQPGLGLSQIRMIRRLAEQLSPRQIAKRYEVPLRVIEDVLSGLWDDESLCSGEVWK